MSKLSVKDFSIRSYCDHFMVPELDEDSQGDIGRAYIISHPGYYLQDDRSYSDPDIRPEDHFRFLYNLRKDVREMQDSWEVYVLEEQGSDYSRSLLKDMDVEPEYIETCSGEVKPNIGGVESFADLINNLEEDAGVIISGELNGLCVKGLEKLLDFTTSEVNKNVNLRKGRFFPSFEVAKMGNKVVPDYSEGTRMEAPGIIVGDVLK